jgi:hypothetical protein
MRSAAISGARVIAKSPGLRPGTDQVFPSMVSGSERIPITFAARQTEHTPRSLSASSPPRCYSVTSRFIHHRLHDLLCLHHTTAPLISTTLPRLLLAFSAFCESLKRFEPHTSGHHNYCIISPPGIGALGTFAVYYYIPGPCVIPNHHLQWVSQGRSSLSGLAGLFAPVSRLTRHANLPPIPLCPPVSSRIRGFLCQSTSLLFRSCPLQACQVALFLCLIPPISSTPTRPITTLQKTLGT